MGQHEVIRLIGDLNADDYATRHRAAERLRGLASRLDLGPLLAEEFQRVLVAEDTSFEVRRCLEPLAAGLPKAATRLGVASQEEIDRLIRQLEDDDYGRRAAARARLEWFVENPRMVCPLLLRFKARMEVEGVGPDAQRWLEPLYRRVRGAWLASDPASWTLPAISGPQIDRWIDDLVRPLGEAKDLQAERIRRLAAYQLRDALARDSDVPSIVAALEKRLAETGLDASATTGIQALLDLARPEMIAECWGRWTPATACRMGRPAQRLVIGVPSLGAGAQRPSHFDRIDDDVAHCVSGQNLSPGDYPVGVAFPHPKQAGNFFHLVNLSSPRRKMGYECQAETPDSRRLLDLSRRTFDWLLARKKPLTVAELNMLHQLDREWLSRFAGRFLEIVVDEPIPEAEVMAQANVLPFPMAPDDSLLLRRLRSGRPSRHGKLCEVLIAQGTRSAARGILEAIEQGRVSLPNKNAPYRLDALALLAISARDRGPETEASLAGLLRRNDALVLSPGESPEVGATAAGLLLGRSGREPPEFGLKPLPDAMLESIGVSGFRFQSPEAGERFRRWWASRRESPDGA